MKCVGNLNRCDANCCKFLVFRQPLLSKGMIKYYELHSNTIVRQTKTGFLIIIYRPCAMLVDNKCAINDEKPQQCKDAYIKDKLNHLFVPYCAYSPIKDSVVLTEKELGRLTNG